MKIVIEKWYNRLLVFIGLEFLGLMICYAPAAISATEGFILWVFFPIVGIIGIGSASSHCKQRMRTLRFIVILFLTMILGILLWTILLSAIFMLSGIDLLGADMLIILTAPMMALWTLACLMILALWPFHAVRNVDSPR